MKKWNGYETTEIMGAKRKLPVGAYVCKIIEAQEMSYGWGSVLLISFDIADGEYKNFYRAQYEKQDKNKKWKGVYRLTCPEMVKQNCNTIVGIIYVFWGIPPQTPVD